MAHETALPHPTLFGSDAITFRAFALSRITSLKQKRGTYKMLKSMLILIVAILLCGTVAMAAPVDKLIICGFENDSDIARFQVRVTTPPSKLNLTSEHVTQGSHAVKIDFPKWQEGSEQWPAIILTNDQGLPADWSTYDAVACDVYNAGSKEATLGLFARDLADKRVFQILKVPAGASRTLRISLESVPKGFDIKQVSELHVHTERPPDAVTVIVDNIRFEDAASRIASAGATLARLKNESKEHATELASFWKDMDATYASLSDRASRVSDSAGLLALRPEIIAFEKRLNLGVGRALAEYQLTAAALETIPSAQYACGFASSMQKVFPKDVAFECSVARRAQVELAGGDTESVQLLIYAFGQDLKNTQVEIGQLHCKGQNEVRPTAEASPVGFVNTAKPPYSVRYVGWHPDPILDFMKSFNVNKGEVEPVWIRVKTPAGTPAGDYYGDIIVRPENAPAVKVGLKVHVWGFDVPKERHLRTAMSLYDSYLPYAYGTVTDEMRMKYEDFVLSYRINPDNIYRKNPPTIESLERWNKQGLNAFNLVYVQKPDGLKAGDPFPTDKKQAIMATLDAIVPQLKEHGLYKKAYVYGFDEIGKESYAAMKDIFGAIKAKYPDLLTLTTGRDHTYGEVSGVDGMDAWCPETQYYYPDRVQKARARGKQVWWYTCIVPQAPYANWLIEYDAIDARMLMGLQTAKYQPDGYLYYAMTRWPKTKKPITDGPYTDWPPDSFYDNNGDGSIICAGPNGPVPTIRLENIRDGIEDYEYFWVLQNEINRLKSIPSPDAEKALKQAENALSIGEDLVASLSNFSKSPSALLAKRRQVAEAIVSAQMVR